MRNLFTTWYNCGNDDRQSEINHCLRANEYSGLFNSVFVIEREGLTIYSPNKIREHFPKENIGKPTFEQFIQLVNKYATKDSINIIANTDIIFDESIKLADNMQTDECYALSRWELNSKREKIHQFNRLQIHGDSQDVWIFKGQIKPIENSSFNIGTRGIDNRIAYEIKKAGYKITNPSNSIHTWHYHVSGVRDYIPAQGYAVPQPYLNVPITSL